MGFPTSVTTKTHILAPPNSTQAAGPILDRLERAVYDHDADITNRGDGFFEFTVPVGARIARDFGSWFKRAPWWPLFFISGGTISLRDDLGVYRVTAEVRTSAYPILHLLVPFVVGAGMTPFHGIVPRLLGGVLVGFAFSAVSYLLARWQFGAWLERTGAEVSDDAASGRLTSA